MLMLLLEMMVMMGHRSVRHRGEPSAVSARTPRLIRAHHQLSARAPERGSLERVTYAQRTRMRFDHCGIQVEKSDNYNTVTGTTTKTYFIHYQICNIFF